MKTLCIISGGIGNEREVSISSGENIMRLLAEERINYQSVIVTKNKKWVINDIELSEEEALLHLAKNNILVFQVVHGAYGEDGELVGKLEDRHISYIGSNKDVMKMTNDKYKTEQLLIKNGYVTPLSRVVSSYSQLSEVTFSYPIVLKPLSEGSSIALFKIESQKELEIALEKTLLAYPEMLVQEFVSGREFTCGVVELDGQTIPLLPTEIILTNGEMFDYDAKYTPDGCKEITPAGVDNFITKKLQETALGVHNSVRM